MDVAAGRSRYLSAHKEKKRLRAAAHRKATMPQRAAERIELEGQWHEEFASGRDAKGQRGLTTAALSAMRQEEGDREDLPALRIRKWDKAKWMKHKSRPAKQAARARYRANRLARKNSSDEPESTRTPGASSSGLIRPATEELGISHQEWSEWQDEWPEDLPFQRVFSEKRNDWIDIAPSSECQDE